jgi:hypothetical protein
MFSKATVEALRAALRGSLTGDAATDCHLTKEDVGQLVDKTGLSELQIKYYLEHFRSRIPLTERASKLDGDDPEEVIPPMSLLIFASVLMHMMQ